MACQWLQYNPRTLLWSRRAECCVLEALTLFPLGRPCAAAARPREHAQMVQSEQAWESPIVPCMWKTSPQRSPGDGSE